ncbi:MAG TPA: hypothetical protein VGI24_10145 [Solirubrobacteraceae bacterium]
MELRASFPLPGMELEEARELPALELMLRLPRELDAVWSGLGGPPQWRGRLGDGLDLTIERGAAGSLMFVYGERARFLLDPDKQRLDCAPNQPGLDWQRALIGKVLPAISVMRGYEALHAAAVDSPEGVVAIMAPSGAGKSTLAIELLGRNQPLFTDDVLTLERTGGGVLAHPGTPHMNIAEQHAGCGDPEALGSTLGVLTGERWLAAHKSAKHTRPVRLLCLLERGPGLPLATHVLVPNPLTLTPYMLGLSTDAKRARSRFHLFADLLGSATLVRLTAGPEHRPGQLADALEQALARDPELIGGAIA